MLSIVMVLYIHNFIRVIGLGLATSINWPRPQPQGPGLGLDLEILASLNITLLHCYDVVFRLRRSSSSSSDNDFSLSSTLSHPFGDVSFRVSWLPSLDDAHHAANAWWNGYRTILITLVPYFHSRYKAEM